MKERKIGIVIPCFNEAENLHTVLARCGEVSSRYPIEFLIVDNGSTDSTNNLLLDYPLPSGISWIRVEKNVGYGNGILQGLKVLENPWLGWIHADLQIEPIEIAKFLQIIEANPKLQFLKGRRKGRALSEIFFTFSMSVYSSIVLREVISDANGQPTILNRDLFNKWSDIPNDFSIDLSILHLAKKHKANIVRPPIKFKKRLAGKSTWNTGIVSRIQLSKRTIRYINKLSKATLE